MSDNAPSDETLNEKGRFAWVLGWAWMIFAAVNVVDILRHDWDRNSAYAGSVLLLISGFVWVIALRPRLRADSRQVLIRNPLRDVQIPWGAVTDVVSRDTVRVCTQRRNYHSWVGHVSNRRRAWFSRSQVQGRAGELTLDPSGKTSADARSDQAHLAAAASATDAEFLANRLNDMADKYRRPSVDAGHTEETVRWSLVSIAVLGIPLLLLLVSLLLP